MKLERLEMLDLISTKNVIVNQVLEAVDVNYFYNKYELEINLALVLFTLLGNTELHQAMNAEDIDWIGFVNENFKLVEELKEGEYKEAYEDILSEIKEGAKAKAKYNAGLGGMIENLGKMFSEENVNKMKELANTMKSE